MEPVQFLQFMSEFVLHLSLNQSRDLRYYRIGIKMSILLPKSIVSVSYQYRNFSCESINISIGIEILDIESISISIGIDFLNIQSQA